MIFGTLRKASGTRARLVSAPRRMLLTIYVSPPSVPAPVSPLPSCLSCRRLLSRLSLHVVHPSTLLRLLPPLVVNSANLFPANPALLSVGSRTTTMTSNTAQPNALDLLPLHHLLPQTTCTPTPVLISPLSPFILMLFAASGALSSHLPPQHLPTAASHRRAFHCVFQSLSLTHCQNLDYHAPTVLSPWARIPAYHCTTCTSYSLSLTLSFSYPSLFSDVISISSESQPASPAPSGRQLPDIDRTPVSTSRAGVSQPTPTPTLPPILTVHPLSREQQKANLKDVLSM